MLTINRELVVAIVVISVVIMACTRQRYRSQANTFPLKDLKTTTPITKEWMVSLEPNMDGATYPPAYVVQGKGYPDQVATIAKEEKLPETTLNAYGDELEIDEEAFSGSGFTKN